MPIIEWGKKDHRCRYRGTGSGICCGLDLYLPYPPSHEWRREIWLYPRNSKKNRGSVVIEFPADQIDELIQCLKDLKLEIAARAASK